MGNRERLSCLLSSRMYIYISPLTPIILHPEQNSKPSNRGILNSGKMAGWKEVHMAQKKGEKERNV